MSPTNYDQNDYDYIGDFEDDISLEENLYYDETKTTKSKKSKSSEKLDIIDNKGKNTQSQDNDYNTALEILDKLSGIYKLNK